MDSQNQEVVEIKTAMIPTQSSNINKFGYAGSTIGFATGIGYAFMHKTGFWKGFGIAIISSIALGALGRGVGAITQKK